MPRKKKTDLKARVDEMLDAMLDSDAEPSEGKMKLLAIAIKKLALDAKMEESSYGEFFSDEDIVSNQVKEKDVGPRLSTEKT